MRWLIGKASVCKTDPGEFDSRPHVQANRGVAQLVAQRALNPSVVRSSRTAPAMTNGVRSVVACISGCEPEGTGSIPVEHPKHCCPSLKGFPSVIAHLEEHDPPTVEVESSNLSGRASDRYNLSEFSPDLLKVS